MKLTIGIGLAIVLNCVAAPAVSAATLLGDTVTCARNGSACFGTSTATVGSGIEFNRVNDTYDFTQTGLNIGFKGALVGVPFDTPLVYNFADTTHAFTAFSNLTFSGLTGFTASNVTLTNGVLGIMLTGVTPTTTNAFVNLNLATGAVPEPASWAMMILGIGAVGFAMRRRVLASEVKFNTKIKRISEGAVA